ncbi:sigma factor-like helix-turn-helix DNA-binding protein [Streptomyces bobili]|uniref:sigma factor-like helix-turn-helix DNA-binding protein n=1 Tax=Streptomyces bobili TaxID=67280 RepID=UPI0033B867D0
MGGGGAVLPARQRAVLVVRGVLAFTAAEVAEKLGTTVAAVNSALQRARAALVGVGDAGAVTDPDDPKAQTVVQRYMRAFEAADVPALVRLPADDAVLEMPPSRGWGRFLEQVFGMRGRAGHVEGHRQRAARARRVRAGTRRRPPTAHSSGLHHHGGSGDAQPSPLDAGRTLIAPSVNAGGTSSVWRGSPSPVRQVAREQRHVDERRWR